MRRMGLITAALLVLLGTALLGLGRPCLAAESFREQNGLKPCQTPAWFLAGNFLAREKAPRYLFGKVGDFVKALPGKTAWLMEEGESKRVKALGEAPGEFTLYLEQADQGQTRYWVFVAMPHQNSQQWFDARRKFHGGKALPYYGKTADQMQNAFDAGLKPQGELRFIVEKGNLLLQAPEEVLLGRKVCRPVWDLAQGKALK